jgi:hypothetical protein
MKNERLEEPKMQTIWEMSEASPYDLSFEGRSHQTEGAMVTDLASIANTYSWYGPQCYKTHQWSPRSKYNTC